MSPRELFERARSLWPNAIILSEPPEEGQPTWEIVELYDQIEASIGESDEWLALAAWAFHQALSRLSRYEAGRTVLPSSVTFQDFDRQMRANLADATWAAVRAEYDPVLG